MAVSTLYSSPKIIMSAKIEEDLSDDEIFEAIKNSMKDLQVTSVENRVSISASLPSTTRSTPKPGLASVADVVHKEEKIDLSKLSEDEQLKLALQESEIEALSTEEQLRRALQVRISIL